MSRNAEPRTTARARRGLAGAAIALAMILGGCSDIYFDRRDSLSFHAGDAVASNIIAQTVDPWPRSAGNREQPADGERMQRAMERYRTNKTTPLVTTSTSSVHYQSATQGSGAAASGGGSATP